MQFSLFGAAAAPPTLDDLDGVLLAGGHWVHAKDGARLSVVVADRWRAEALAEAFAEREVADAGAVGPAEAGLTVRTTFAPQLVPRAARWIHGAVQLPPADFQLTPGGLRLWTIAVGRPDEVGYLLGTAEVDDDMHRAAGAQLARLNIAAVSIGLRGGPGWRVTSVKRLRRLIELVGDAPPGGLHSWPRLGGL